MTGADQLEGLPGCFHCGLPVPANAPWQIMFDGKSQRLCCAGCEAVASTIIDGGLDAYYRQRTSQGDGAQLAGQLPQTLLQAEELDSLQSVLETGLSPESSDGPSSAGSRPSSQFELSVEGMHCGACVWLIEQGLLAQPGVRSAVANLSSERVSVVTDPNEIALKDVLKSIAKLGYRAAPYQSDGQNRQRSATSRRNLQRLFVAGIGMMQVMMVALPGYLAGDGDIESQYASLLRWAALVLTTPVILYSAWPFFQSAYQNLRFRRVGIDVPVSIGLLAAYSWSVVATVRGSGEVYFDSVAMFVFLLLLARHLQWLIRRRGLARLDALGARTPKVATQWVDGERKRVNPAVLVPGDIITVSTGQAVPVDAALMTGSTLIDQAILTGESVPVQVGVGDRIAAGCFVTGAAARMTVLSAVQDSAVSRLEAMVARGQTEKPRWVLLADQVASWFVLAVIGLAVLAGFVWSQIDPSQAWPIAMTILVVSCPCALSLATPSALSAATGGLLSQGILITKADAIEALAGATDVVFDKTGTLTQGRPTVVATDFPPEPGGALDESLVLSLAVALEEGVDHPYASALRDQLSARQLKMADSVQVTEHRAGYGVAGVWQSEAHGRTELRLGSHSWCGLNDQAGRWPDHGPVTEVVLARRDGADPSADWQALARFCLTDPLRANAPEVITALHRLGFKRHLVSGDQSEVVRFVADELGIGSWQAGVLPEQKQGFVRDLQQQGRRVIMVGDGLNDAPVLSLADVSVAVGQASDLARTAADIIALNADPRALLALIDKARQARQVIRQNLVFSLIYNFCAIPAAALGWVPPWLAAIGMAASSWLVVANSARLWGRTRQAPGPVQARAPALSTPERVG